MNSGFPSPISRARDRPEQSRTWQDRCRCRRKLKRNSTARARKSLQRSAEWSTVPSAASICISRRTQITACGSQLQSRNSSKPSASLSRTSRWVRNRPAPWTQAKISKTTLRAGSQARDQRRRRPHSSLRISSKESRSPRRPRQPPRPFQRERSRHFISSTRPISRRGRPSTSTRSTRIITHI